jgi:EAL domain-containing protein (putative c-di-GMP-specific phosphodiesterase class I)
MIIPVGEWVIRQACTIHRQWREAGSGEKRIAVNASAAQFNDEHLLERVSRALKEEGMPPHAFELEITENTVMP